MLATVISAIGATTGLFLAVAIWLRDSKRSPQSAFLCLSLLLVAANMLDDALTLAHVYDKARYLAGWSYPTHVAIGPSFLLYVSSLAAPRLPVLRQAKGSLIAGACILLCLLPWCFAGGEVRWLLENQPDQLRAEYYPTAFSITVYVFSSAALQGWCLSAAVRRARAAEDPALRARLLRLAWMALGGWAAYIAGILLGFTGAGDQFILSIINLVLASGFYAIALLAVIDPPTALPQTPNAAINRAPKYQRQALSPADAERIVARLDDLVARDRVHRDSGLTLQKLATLMRTSTNDLSQALNIRRDGFHDWLARVRIEDAIALMEEGGEVSGILDAAFHVGFNAKSTFYEAFRRRTGQTPAAWLEGRRAAETASRP